MRSSGFSFGFSYIIIREDNTILGSGFGFGFGFSYIIIIEDNIQLPCGPAPPPCQRETLTTDEWSAFLPFDVSRQEGTNMSSS